MGPSGAVAAQRARRAAIALVGTYDGMGADDRPGGPQNAPAAHAFVDAGYAIARYRFSAFARSATTYSRPLPGSARLIT